MPKFVIEREIPGAGAMSREPLKAVSKLPAAYSANSAPQIQWVHSYVTDDKIYCIYNAPNEEMVREHAKLGGFPANSVAQVRTYRTPPQRKINLLGPLFRQPKTT